MKCIICKREMEQMYCSDCMKQHTEDDFRVESLETAVKDLQEQIDKILKTMEALSSGKNR